MLPGDNPAFHTTNTENNFEMKEVVEKKKLHRMAKIHNYLKMWQGSQNLHAMQTESRTRNVQMTAVGYILDMEDIIKSA